MKGRKRHILVDVLGLPLANRIEPANMSDPVAGSRLASSLELGRRLGVTQTTAWTVKPKLKQVMMERDAKKRLIGRVEMDDAYLGGQRSGGKRGHGAAGKMPIVATVETTAKGCQRRLKFPEKRRTKNPWLAGCR